MKRRDLRPRKGRRRNGGRPQLKRYRRKQKKQRQERKRERKGEWTCLTPICLYQDEEYIAQREQLYQPVRRLGNTNVKYGRPTGLLIICITIYSTRFLCINTHSYQVSPTSVRYSLYRQRSRPVAVGTVTARTSHFSQM